MSWYRTGTATFTNGSAVVTGAGTDFVANVLAGFGLVAPDGRTYEIASIQSATQLTLATNYQGSTGGGSAYAIFPTHSATLQLVGEVRELVTDYADMRDGVGQGLFSDGSAAAPALRFTLDQDTGIYRLANNSLGVAAGGTLILAVSSSGIVVTGAASFSGGITGDIPVAGNVTFNTATDRSIGWGGNISAGAANALIYSDGSYLVFNAKAGSHLYFNFDNSNAASTVNFFAGKAVFQQDGTATISGLVRPGTDNAFTLGSASFRWSSVFAATGSINTSDEREKEQIGEIPDDWLDAWGAVRWVRFKFKDSVAENGAAARWHAGLIAQEVHAAFAAEGIDAFAIGLCCFDEWPDEYSEVVDDEGQPTGEQNLIAAAGDRWGLRYTECFAIDAAWQRRENTRMAARLAALEAAA